MSQYYYRAESGDRGPFSFEELHDLYQQGHIGNDTLIREIGGFDWLAIRNCTDLDFSLSVGNNLDASGKDAVLIKYLASFGFNHLQPTQFEEFVMMIFEAFGFRGELTPITGDDGIDIVLKSSDGSKVIVQCKRYSQEQNVGVRDVRELLGSIVHANAICGFFVTTSSFSEQAAAFVGGKNILLVDGDKLRRLFVKAVESEFAASPSTPQEPVSYISRILAS